MLRLDERPNAADLALSMAGMEAEMALRARRSAFAAVKRRARAYMAEPMLLESLARDLAYASPECLIATGLSALANERNMRSRYFGFGGETRAVNARAAILLGRWQRFVAQFIRKAA